MKRQSMPVSTWSSSFSQAHLSSYGSHNDPKNWGHRTDALICSVQGTWNMQGKERTADYDYNNGNLQMR